MRLARRRRGSRRRRRPRVRGSEAPARRLAREPARTAARLAPLDQRRRCTRRACALHPGRHRAPPRAEPALPHRPCRWPPSGSPWCGATASATECSSTPWSRSSHRSRPAARCRSRASSWARSRTRSPAASSSTASAPGCAATLLALIGLRARGLHVGDLPRRAGLRRSLAIVLAVAALHAGAALAYHGDGQDLPATYFYPRAHAVAHGTDAYGGLDYEYPPATLPLLVAPLAAGGDDSGPGLPPAHDLALRGAGRRLRAPARVPAAAPGRGSSSSWRSALYSVSVLVLGRLALTRFDLVAGIAILLAGHGARSPGRAGAWLGVAGALKLVPLAAAPALARRGTSVPRARRRRRRPDRRPGRRTRSGAASSGSAGSATTRAATPRSSRGRPCSPTSLAGSARTPARPSTTAARTSRARLGALARTSLRARLARPPRCCSPGARAGPTRIPRSRCWRRSPCSSRSRRCSRPSTCCGSRRSRPISPRASRCRRVLLVLASRPHPRSSCAGRSTTCRASTWGAIALVALRNAALVALRGRPVEFGYCASERKTRQAGLSLPFVNVRPVWKPGGERLPRLLVADQEPDQHVDARVRARRGDVAPQLLRLVGQADALEAVRRVGLQPELGDPEVQVLAGEGLVEPRDQAREIGERRCRSGRASVPPSCPRRCGTGGASRRRAADAACRATSGSAAARRRARNVFGPE